MPGFMPYYYFSDVTMNRVPITVDVVYRHRHVTAIIHG